MGRPHILQGLPLLLVLPLATGAGTPPATHAATMTPNPDCFIVGPDAIGIADDVMAGVLVLPSHGKVRIPTDPTWREDLGRDPNWAFQYHSLRWVGTLLEAWQETGRDAYRRRASRLLEDWHLANQPDRSASPAAWNDHAAAWRAGVYACAVRALGRPSWLMAAIRRHGKMLADASFYVGRGNHALNQDIGLLEAGLALARSDWIDLAVRRVSRVIATDIDPQGVNTEGSVGYQRYIYWRACVARTLIRDAGRKVPAVFERVDRMPAFLADATLPDGTLATLGDTEADRAPRLAGSAALPAAALVSTDPRARGAGVSDQGDYALYRGGYAFGRTAADDLRPAEDDIAYSIRFGAAPSSSHQHDDGGSLALFGYGQNLLVDPGKYTYEVNAWRAWFISRSAHNVVTVTGVAARPTVATVLSTATSASMRLYRVRTSTYPGTTLTRTIVWSTGGRYLIVEDRATSTQSRTLVQRWHLAPGSSPARSAASVWTRRLLGNVLVRQLAGGAVRIVSGTTTPIQGWYSPSYGTRLAAPVVETSKTGTDVRFLTLVVPAAGPRPSVTVSGLRLLADGFEVRVAVNGRHERVIVRSGSASVIPLD